jgi:flavin-binding protein dodecin
MNLLAGGQEQLFRRTERSEFMSTSTYKIIELVGSSPVSWEEAAKNAVDTASKTLRDLRVAEITKFDMKIEKGKITAYRTRVSLSFKYESGE